MNAGDHHHMMAEQQKREIPKDGKKVKVPALKFTGEGQEVESHPREKEPSSQ